MHDENMKMTQKGWFLFKSASWSHDAS